MDAVLYARRKLPVQLSMQLKFRRATPDDIRTCLILRGKTRENVVSVERLAAMGITEESWSEDVRTGALPGYVCNNDQSIVGYCFGDKASGEILVLALLPAFEARGIGGCLLGLVVKHLSDAGHTRLFLGSATDSEVRSYGFYRHLGWTSTGALDRAGDEILEFFPLTSASDSPTDLSDV